ncbi:MAG: SNF2-related protein [Vicinamibacterales bacterium]
MPAVHGRLSFERGPGDPVWVIDADPHVHIRAKRIFGKLSTQSVGTLRLSHSPETCRDLAWFLERYPLELVESDRAVLVASAMAHRETIARLDQLIDPSYTPQAFALAVPARDYQAREAEIYLSAGGLLIGDDVGLGKTAAAICSFTDGRTLPALVVTLAHLPRQWEREIGKFAPSLHVHILKRGTPYELPRFMGQAPDVIICNYHKLAGWSRVLAEYCRSVVFDEVQELRRPGSQKAAAARYLADRLPFKLGLSATPVYNYGGEIYQVLNTLRPGALGTPEEFQAEWCAGDRLKDPRAFGAWARENFLIVRHTRREVGRELPDVIRIPQQVDTDASALRAVEESVAELARLILSRTAESFRGERLQASEQISVMLRQATGVAKAPFVADFVRLLVEAGEKVVLCGWHRAVYDIWLDRLKDLRPVLYTGSETAVQKENAKMRFCVGDSQVLILSLRSGAGMNGLQEASSVIVFGELDWSPGVHEQCIGRLARDGQASAVVAYFLVADEGSDPVIAETLGIKREQVEGIRNPTEDFLEELQTDGAHAKRLARHYLEQRGEPIDDAVDQPAEIEP